MGFNIKKVASVVSTVSSIADTAGMLSGININGLNTSNLGSIKSSIQSALNGQTSSIMSQLESAIVPGDIQSMVDGFDIEGKASQLQSQIQVPSMDASSFDQSQIDSQVNQMMEQLNGQINSSMNLSSINFM